MQASTEEIKRKGQYCVAGMSTYPLTTLSTHVQAHQREQGVRGRLLLHMSTVRAGLETNAYSVITVSKNAMHKVAGLNKNDREKSLCVDLG